jgi:hypothetical protein
MCHDSTAIPLTIVSIDCSMVISPLHVPDTRLSIAAHAHLQYDIQQISPLFSLAQGRAGEVTSNYAIWQIEIFPVKVQAPARIAHD